jgi:hypothetical protein
MKPLGSAPAAPFQQRFCEWASTIHKNVLTIMTIVIVQRHYLKLSGLSLSIDVGSSWDRFNGNSS